MQCRRFIQDFKRSLLEQLLSETSTPAKLCISLEQIYTWKRQYAQGKLNPASSREAELTARVQELERLFGKVTLENEFLKKAAKNTLKQAEKRDTSLPKIAPLSKAFKGGAN